MGCKEENDGGGFVGVGVREGEAGALSCERGEMMDATRASPLPLPPTPPPTAAPAVISQEDEEREGEEGEEDNKKNKDEEEQEQEDTDDEDDTPPTTASRTRAITHPIARSAAPRHVRRAPLVARTGSYPSSPRWRPVVGIAGVSQGMSANPAVQVAESLRSSTAGSSLSSTRRASMVGEEMVREEGEMMQEEGDQMVREDEEMVRGDEEMMDSSLPADDGMNDLRQRLQEIKKLAISTEEKAMRMHTLMTQDYVTRHPGDASPMSLSDGDARSWADEPAALDVGAAALPINPANPYNIRDGDLEPTWSPLPHMPLYMDDMEESIEEEHPIVMGCMHYKRNVKVQCFDCHRWFPCRYCHDQSHDLPFPHSLRRKMTRNMLCMLCKTPQPAAEVCINCGEYAAYYYCSKCKLWDNDSNKRIYHCNDCEICRLGEGLGKDYIHCKKCAVCISIAFSSDHACVENATKGPCPLCLDDMFASRAKVVRLPCGHYMHGECFRDLMAVTYKCPVCSKSAVNMQLQWRKLDDEITAQPMPEDDEDLEGLLPHIADANPPNHAPDPSTPSRPPRRPRKVWISCNDCINRCYTPFHWLGLKCQHCDSYNTTQIPPTFGHVESSAERALREQNAALESNPELTGAAVLRAAGIGAASPVDSAIASETSLLAVPGSPTPSSPTTSSGGLPSPRRYFEPDPPRRPSFTNYPRFSTPTLPTLPTLPRLSNMNMQMPDFATHFPDLSTHLPDLAGHLPDFSGRLPGLPGFGGRLPDFALPEFALPEFLSARRELLALPDMGRFSPGGLWGSWVGRTGEGEEVGVGVGGRVRGGGGVRRRSGLSFWSDPGVERGWDGIGGGVEGGEGEEVGEESETDSEEGGGEDDGVVSDDEEMGREEMLDLELIGHR